jgi:hypothetical protein
MKGYLVLAQNSENVNYVQQAYALALSLHASQDTCLISLVTNDLVPDEYKKVFDKIIPIPGNDDAANSLWKVENRWKLYHVTPYDETIVFDTDMLVFKSFNGIWDTLSKYDVFFASNVLDFKSNQVVDYYNRKMFNENDLPNLYFGLHYFKKNKPALDFYNTLAFVVANWERVYFDIAPKSKQKWVSMDVSAAIAAKILGIDDSITHPTFDFRFTHMKANLQGIDPIPSAWTKVLDYYINRQGNLIVSNIQQTGIFHYVENNFLDSTIISALEEVYNGKRN